MSVLLQRKLARPREIVFSQSKRVGTALGDCLDSHYKRFLSDWKSLYD